MVENLSLRLKSIFFNLLFLRFFAVKRFFNGTIYHFDLTRYPAAGE